MQVYKNSERKSRPKSAAFYVPLGFLSNPCSILFKSTDMTKDEAKNLIETYGKAWETRDPDLILTIFTPDATYDDPHEPKNFGHDEIRAYWVSKVIGEQEDIRFKLLNVWIDGDTVIAEWHALFKDTKRNLNIDMVEVAIFGTKDGKFSSLREYYKTVKTAA